MQDNLSGEYDKGAAETNGQDDQHSIDVIVIDDREAILVPVGCFDMGPAAALGGIGQVFFQHSFLRESHFQA